MPQVKQLGDGVLHRRGTAYLTRGNVKQVVELHDDVIKGHAKVVELHDDVIKGHAKAVELHDDVIKGHAERAEELIHPWHVLEVFENFEVRDERTYIYICGLYSYGLNSYGLSIMA